jgi:hypothetical protein
MIHVLQKKCLRVRPIARVVKSEVLPGTRPQSVIPRHDARDYNRCGFRSIALSEKIFAGCEFQNFVTQPPNRSDVGTGNGRVVSKLSQNGVAWHHFLHLTQLTTVNARRPNLVLYQMIKIRKTRSVIMEKQAQRCVMPIRPFLAGQPFDPETITMMSAALENVCKALDLKIVDDPATRLVAQKIIELTQRGMQDATMLSAATLKELKGD